ncbi:hypothetical protein [Kribbella italica]|uniref:Uncharacterized protein n=1 Tax=Kribbella italica TaxID=1540520 RepID=A0A7W9J0J0_9ACTN|nr:hypothetical protein [Kribbella italica]MBB5833391.1 hypothetical protein [Kribbella italica]
MAGLTRTEYDEVLAAGIDFLGAHDEWGAHIELVELEEHFLGTPLDPFVLVRELREEGVTR